MPASGCAIPDRPRPARKNLPTDQPFSGIAAGRSARRPDSGHHVHAQGIRRDPATHCVPLGQGRGVRGRLNELDQLTARSTVTRATCLRLLPGVTRDLHRLQVSTLDSFFARIAAATASIWGFPPLDIADDLDDGLLRDRAIDEVLRDDSDRDLPTVLNLLTKARRAAESVNYSAARWMSSTTCSRDRFGGLDQRAARQTARDVAVGRSARSVADDHLSDNNRLRKARDGDYVAACNENWDYFVAKGLVAGNHRRVPSTTEKTSIPRWSPPTGP